MTWSLTEPQFDLARYPLNETLFALGNGYIGTRGAFVEGVPGHGIDGTFLNGFYEVEPISYGEKLYGFPTTKQTMLSVPNAKVIQLTVDGEPFSLLTGTVEAYERVLDLRAGTLTRTVTWTAPSGRRLRLSVVRAVLHVHRHRMVIRYEVTPLNFSGRLELVSGINRHVEALRSEHDPRVGSGLAADALQPEGQQVEGREALLLQRTRRSDFVVATAVGHRVFDGRVADRPVNQDRFLGVRFDVDARQGEPVSLEKYVAYVTSRDVDEAEVAGRARAEVAEAASTGAEPLLAEQKTYLDNFWRHSDVEIAGDEQMQLGIRFNMFHLLQSTGRDGRTNVAAKGLTGLGYEGHYFWDTEIYMQPFFLYTNPRIARRLLAYRYSILDSARQRARELAQPRGALYPWRTISGTECSPYFPGGTAQYHINADIAYAVQRYVDATGDSDFLREMGAEILFETARLWAGVGHFSDAHDGQFCIDMVTGPDEYTACVNNNAYTNLMAAANLRNAARAHAWLAETDPDALADIAARIDLEDEEAARWRRAAERMFVPYDRERGLIAQDDSFLQKAVWDFENTPEEDYPLLLHYHPLVLYRYQVCKQADTLLAHFLLHGAYDAEQKRRDYDYYEPLTTHDSSLSTCIFSILAAELGDTEKAYNYFVETALTDLEDKQGNSRDGIHAASMGGAWLAIVAGFGGMRVTEGTLSFRPVLPAAWNAYAFRVRFRGRLLQVRVTGEGAQVTLEEGEPLTVTLNGSEISVGGDATPTR